MHVVPVKLLYIRPLYHILLQGKKENKKTTLLLTCCMNVLAKRKLFLYENGVTLRSV